MHSELKKAGRLKSDFNLRQCFFGEHLLTVEKEKPLAIVEAEKTAVIASICFSEFVWLACGSKQNLKAEKLEKYANRQIILYPDADGFAQWTTEAQQARQSGLTARVSNLVETHATDVQRADGYDLADYLISEQIAVNQHNLYAEEYNSALEKSFER